MNKILNYVTWALLTFFLVPSGLIMASWNAVPGDALYPIKTGLEKTLVKITPSLALQSSLEMSYTERRLGETEALLADAFRAQETIQSLNNLDAQVAQAQYAIESVSDPSQKAALAEKYIDTLARIASKLDQSQQNLAAAPDYQTPTMAVRYEKLPTTQSPNTTQQQTVVTTKPSPSPQATSTPNTTPKSMPSPTPLTTTTSNTTVATRLATSQTTVSTTITNMQRLRKNNSMQNNSTKSAPIQGARNDGVKNTEEKKSIESPKPEEQKNEQKVEQKTEQKSTTTDQLKVETKTEVKTDTKTENSNVNPGH